MEKELKKILDDNKDKRVCVCGVSCSGKTTIMKNFPNSLDLDEIAWLAVPPKIQEVLSGQKKFMTYAKMRENGVIRDWTKEQSKIWETHAYKTANEFKIRPGQPVFSAVPLNHTDLIIYLDISPELLYKRAMKRGRDPEKIRKAKIGLEQVIAEKGLPVINLKF